MLNWKLKNIRDVVPRGFAYKHPETGHVSEGNSYEAWMSKVQEHRRGNNLPPLDPAVAEDQLCSKLPPQSCKQYCQSADPAAESVNAVALHWTDILRGTKTIAAFKLAGSPLVSQEEANRRAAICFRCQFNTPFVKPCGGMCGELLEVVNAIVGGARTDHADSLEACAVCSCALTAKIWIPLEILQRYESPELAAKYPASHCWLSRSNSTPSESDAIAAL